MGHLVDGPVKSVNAEILTEIHDINKVVDVDEDVHGYVDSIHENGDKIESIAVAQFPDNLIHIGTRGHSI